MGRKKLPESEKKINITLRLKKRNVEKLKTIKNYNSKCEQLVEDMLKDNK